MFNILLTKNVRFKTPMLRSDLCDYSDRYIVVKKTIDFSAAAANEDDKAEKSVAFKNSALFTLYISKTNNSLIDSWEDLDIVMPMYNLLEYSDNFSTTSGSFWNYYLEETDGVDDNSSQGKSFKYKTKITGKKSELWPQPGNPGDTFRPAQPTVPSLSIEVTIPLKYLSKFCRYLDLPLIKCEVELDLSWTKNCVLLQHQNDITVADFEITSSKLCIPVAT